MEPQNLKVLSGAATLNTSVWGTTGPVLLALHPGVGDSRIWSSCGPRWAAAGYRVIAYDRRGFGSTSVTPEAHDDIDDLIAVMDAVDAQSAVIVGNSSGGGLAIDFALSHPARVSAQVLLAPSVSGYNYDDWPTTPAEAEQDSLIAAAIKAKDLQLVNRLETRYWLDGVAQAEGRVSGEPRTLFTDMNRVALSAPPNGTAATRPSAWPMLAKIETPVLVAVGEFDLPGIQDQCSDLVTLVPQAELVVIPESAHCPQLDQSELLVRTVLEFLGEGRAVQGSG